MMRYHIFIESFIIIFRSLPGYTQKSACLKPEATQPDKFLRRSNYTPLISNTMNNSLENGASREALLIVISSLIQENQSLKSEKKLKSKLNMQGVNSPREVNQAFLTLSDKVHSDPYQGASSVEPFTFGEKVTVPTLLRSWTRIPNSILQEQ